MSVAGTIARKTFAGDGVTTSFGTSPMVFFNTSDLEVRVTVNSTGVSTLLVENTDYTVSGGGTLIPATGTVNLAGGSSPHGAVASGSTLVITRVLPLTQDDDFVNNDASDADVAEAALDKLTMITQQIQDALDRSFTLPTGDVSGASTELPTPSATSLLGWDSNGTALTNYSTSTLALALTTAFTLTLLDDPDAATFRNTLGIALAAKGSLLTGRGSNAVGEKTIGTDGYTLRPSNGATDGLAWVGCNPFDIINGSLTASVASNALTVALKGLDGNDPSDTNPVFIVFRNATASTGTPGIIKVTAATSIVVPSTATLGTSNGVAARIWVVGFNDGGTFRLGVVNCLSGSNIFPLRDDVLASSTLTPANSAQVIYTTGAAVTSKPMRILGYLEATEATAGTWATAPSKLQSFGPGVSMPGQEVQSVVNPTGAVATGTTTVPNDDTIPQNTEGDQYVTQAITPTSAVNLLRIEAIGEFAGPVGQFAMSLYQDSGANALKTAWLGLTNANSPFQLTLRHDMLAGLATATTFKIRAGNVTAGTTTFNGSSAARFYGGVLTSYIAVREIMA